MRARHNITGRQIQLFILGASLVAFAGAFLSAGLPRHIDPLQPIRSAPVRLMNRSPSATNDIRYLLADLLDPSVSSLPTPQGFSRASWQRAPSAAYEPSEFRMSPATLALTRSPELLELLPQTALTTEVQANAERTPPVGDVPDSALNGGTALNQSIFRISGGLAARTLVRGPKLGLIESAVPLRSTSVRVGVGADGLVRYALVENSSSDTAVDARAVAWAREFRFEPRAEATANPKVEWGMVKFLWAFSLPVTTNAPAASAPTP